MMAEACEQKHKALVALMEDWARFQRTYAPNLGYPSRSITCYSAGSSDFDTLCEAADKYAYEVINTVVYDDLPPAQHGAIMRAYELAGVYRFPRENFKDCLDRAHEAVARALQRNGVML